MKMYIDVENIEKYDKKTWSKIYEAIYEHYFIEIKILPKDFPEHC